MSAGRRTSYSGYDCCYILVFIVPPFTMFVRAPYAYSSFRGWHEIIAFVVVSSCLQRCGAEAKASRALPLCGGHRYRCSGNTIFFSCLSFPSSQSYAIPVRRAKLDEAAGSFERTLVNSRAANRKLRVRKLLAFLCVEVTPGSGPITYYQFDFGFRFRLLCAAAVVMFASHWAMVCPLCSAALPLFGPRSVCCAGIRCAAFSVQ